MLIRVYYKLFTYSIEGDGRTTVYIIVVVFFSVMYRMYSPETEKNTCYDSAVHSVKTQNVIEQTSVIIINNYNYNYYE